VSILTFLISVLLVADSSATNLLLTLSIFLVYTVIYGSSHFATRQTAVGPALHYVLVTFDCLAITTIIHLTGGIRSPLYFLYLTVLGVSLYNRDLGTFVFSAILSMFLYAGLLIHRSATEHTPNLQIAGYLVLMGMLIGVLHVLLVMLLREQEARDRLVSRAKTTAQISDILSGSLSNSKDWIKNITTLLDQEIKPMGLECRIVVHKGDQQFLPPSVSKVGVHIPIMVGECIFGTLIVTRDKKTPFTPQDHDFFSSIARSLGQSLHRAKLWDDFQAQLSVPRMAGD
jgi:K+-sensing histidine kinase KdpD